MTQERKLLGALQVEGDKVRAVYTDEMSPYLNCLSNVEVARAATIVPAFDGNQPRWKIQLAAHLGGDEILARPDGSPFKSEQEAREYEAALVAARIKQGGSHVGPVARTG